jgi:hypothetical protein
MKYKIAGISTTILMLVLIFVLFNNFNEKPLKELSFKSDVKEIIVVHSSNTDLAQNEIRVLDIIEIREILKCVNGNKWQTENNVRDRSDFYDFYLYYDDRSYEQFGYFLSENKNPLIIYKSSAYIADNKLFKLIEVFATRDEIIKK